MDEALDRMHKLIEELDALKKKVDAVKVTELTEGNIEESEKEKKLLEDIQQAQRAWAQPDMCNCVSEEQQRSKLHIEYSKRAESYWSKLQDAYKGEHIPKNDLSNKYKEMDETLKLLSLEIDVVMFKLDPKTKALDTGRLNEELGTKEEKFVDLLILIWKLSIDIADLSGDSHKHNSKLYNFIINEDRWQTDLKTILCFLLIYTNDLNRSIRRSIKHVNTLLPNSDNPRFLARGQDLEYYYIRVVCVNHFLQALTNTINSLEEFDAFKNYNSSKVKVWWENLLSVITNWIYRKKLIGTEKFSKKIPITIYEQQQVQQKRQKDQQRTVRTEYDNKLDKFQDEIANNLDHLYKLLDLDRTEWRVGQEDHMLSNIDKTIDKETDNLIIDEINQANTTRDKAKLRNIVNILDKAKHFTELYFDTLGVLQKIESR